MHAEPGRETNTINILLVIDTEYIKKNYAAAGEYELSPVPVDPSCVFAIYSGMRDEPEGASECEGLLIEFGSTLVFRATSVSNNSDDAVIVYQVNQMDGESSFTDWVTLAHAVRPDPQSVHGGVPPVEAEASFQGQELILSEPGVQFIDIRFAMYTLAEDEQSQVLYGYFSLVMEVFATETPFE